MTIRSGLILKRMMLPSLMLPAVSLFAFACGGNEEEVDPTPRTSPAHTSPAATSPSGSSNSVEIKAIPVLKFDKSSLTVPARREVKITLDNQDTGVIHNFALYRNKADADALRAAIDKTDLCAGPCKEDIEVTLDPGDYPFKCDIHPEMNGNVRAQ